MRKIISMMMKIKMMMMNLIQILEMINKNIRVDMVEYGEMKMVIVWKNRGKIIKIKIRNKKNSSNWLYQNNCYRLIVR